jgi:CubicO group peptidase (beta-lactamase class C family)
MRHTLLRLALPFAYLAACTSAPEGPPPAAAAGTIPLPADPAARERLRRASAEVLFWSQEQRDANFRQMERLFPSHLIPAGGRVRPLPAGAPLPRSEAEAQALMERGNIAALIVVADGRIRLERYARGLSGEDRWTSFSVAKSLTSTLVGAAVRDGHIRSVDDPVTRYLPELAGSAYDGVSVRQVLTMSSGVRWNENYADPTSDIALLFSTTPPEGMDPTIAYLRTLPRAHPPGTRWNYNTAETNLIGLIVARAVGRPLARYASEKIWRAYGMEADAYWQMDESGKEVAGCCISARPRDYARIGQFILDGGRAGGRDVLPAGWIDEATRAHHSVSPRGDGYGFQWWTRPGAVAARGIFGQSILIDRERRLVMVTLAAWPQATAPALRIAAETYFTETVAAEIDAERGR